MNSIEVHSSYTTESCLTSNGRCAGGCFCWFTLARSDTRRWSKFPSFKVLADPWNLHMRECSMVYPGSYTQHKCSARLMYFYWGQNLLQLQLKVWGGWRMKIGIYGLENYLLTMHIVSCLFEQVSFGLLVASAKYERYIPVWEELLFKCF